MLVVNYQEKDECLFDFPFRMFISGSSQSGKTFFAEKLLSRDLFTEKIGAVHYRHPDYLQCVPVEWHKTLSVPVSYQTGLPTMEDLCKLEPGTCIVLDDLYEECLSSKPIDYLFRVLSGKKRLSVIIMSQRYFAKGKFGMNIRNNCNFTVLMRNTDARVNQRISRSFNIHRQVIKCLKQKCAYPYVFIDTTPSAMVSGFRVYEDIFSNHMIVHSDDEMRGYIIPENDFHKYFIKVNENFAKVRYENTKATKRKRKRATSDKQSKARKRSVSPRCERKPKSDSESSSTSESIESSSKSTSESD